MENIEIYLMVLLALAVYFFPADRARARGHKNTKAIFVLNLFLGLTGIGWVIALIWAYTDNVKGGK